MKLLVLIQPINFFWKCPPPALKCPTEFWNTSPAVVVCRKCDSERLAPNQCSCRVHSHFNKTKKEVGVLCKKPSVDLFGGDVVKCMKCQNPCHAACAKWLPDRRRKSPFHRLPYCLGCEHQANKEALLETNA